MSDHDVACAQRLKAVWHKKHKVLGLTQTKAANALGWTNPVTFNNYLHGRMPMGLEAKLKLANLLGVHPTEIDPSISDILPHSAELTESEFQLLTEFRKLNKEMQSVILAQVRAAANAKG